MMPQLTNLEIVFIVIMISTFVRNLLHLVLKKPFTIVIDKETLKLIFDNANELQRLHKKGAMDGQARNVGEA